MTSNESNSIASNTEFDPFSLSTVIKNNKQPSIPIATSPKSNREYITSFTTTTTTTQKPHIENGVKIIRELAEKARTTDEPDTNRPIQSLTTIKSTAKENSVTTHKPKFSINSVPANHRPTWVSFMNTIFKCSTRKCKCTNAKKTHCIRSNTVKLENEMIKMKKFQFSY